MKRSYGPIQARRAGHTNIPNLAVSFNKLTAVSSAREQNYRWAEELAEKGKQFRDVIECELCWYFETRHFLKGGSRVIAMADYKAEKALVLAVPHRVLLGDDELPPDDPKPKSKPMVRSRRPRDCPF